jgi:hypothetical protein
MPKGSGQRRQYRLPGRKCRGLPTLATAPGAPIRSCGLPYTRQVDATNPSDLVRQLEDAMRRHGVMALRLMPPEQVCGAAVEPGRWRGSIPSCRTASISTNPLQRPNYPTSLNPVTDGLRNITGRNNGDGTVNIWAVLDRQCQRRSGADPNKLVAVNDILDSTDPAIAPPGPSPHWSPPAMPRCCRRVLHPRHIGPPPSRINVRYALACSA